MTRREAREVYLQFTGALRSHFPVFQNDNMLYHELKGHYFLYLARHGSWERLCEEVLERPRGTASVDTPRGRPLLHRELGFDRAEVDRRLASIDSHALRPRYQSDLIDDRDRARLDRELPPQERSPSRLVYDPSTGELQCLSPAAAMLLERCDGRRSLAEVVEPVPAEARAEAERCVHEMALRGLHDPAAH
jgi:hypothetical protein